MDRYLVISSDCHAGLRPERYRDYLDPQYRDVRPPERRAPRDDEEGRSDPRDGGGEREVGRGEPSEYFRRNIKVGSSCMPRREAEMRHEIGLGNIMWGTDFPHPEGTWPLTRKMMIETFQGLPEDEIAVMLGGNAAEFYGFDTEKLAPIVDRIGPERDWFRGDAV